MFYDYLKSICDSKGIKITPLVAECGGAKGSISNWKKGASPNSDIVAKLAVRLNVSTDTLIFGKKLSNCSPDEEELLTNYRAVNDIKKAQIRERAAVLAELEAAKKKNNVQTPLKQSLKRTETAEKQEPQYISLPFPALPASAGAGEYLHEDTTSYIKVPLTNLTQRSSFALRVHGDSMEPDYFDGDIVLVDADADVNVGDVGIFIVNGEGFIKQRGKDRLISLNNKYKDIRISADDTCVCKGKVIGSL